ncbi:MAG: alpha/beta hydrolase [Dehalococcoidia bacterium]|nr:alpha/beta hydrolase [Dehalococcoidia bacterium]
MPATYRAEQFTTTFATTAGRTVPAIVIAPVARVDGPLTADDRFPVVLFLQGGNAEADRYLWLAALADHGYLVMIPDAPPITMPVPGTTQTTQAIVTTVDLMHSAIAHTRTLNASESPVAGRVLPKVAVGGHSMGASIAIVGMDPARVATDSYAQFPPDYTPDPSIAALWFIGGYKAGDPDPTVPFGLPSPAPIVYLIAAEHDGMATPAKVREAHARFPAQAFYYELPGGNHFGWCRYTKPTDWLDRDRPATITPEAQQEATIAALLPFLAYALRGDTAAAAAIPTTP